MLWVRLDLDSEGKVNLGGVGGGGWYGTKIPEQGCY